IDEDDMEEMDIKWNIALLSMKADRAPRIQDRGRRANYKQGSKVEEQAPKALMAIDGVGWDWSYMANDEENHALIADEETPIEFALMAKTSAESAVVDNSLCSKASLAQVESRLAEHRSRELKYCKKIRVLKFKTESSADCIKSLKKELELIKKEKEGLDTKLTGFQTALKDLDSLLGRLPKCADDTVTNYSRPAPTVESFPDDAQNRNPSVTKTEASPITISPKPFIKFVKANDSPTKSKTDKVKTAKKPPVKYAEQYKKPTKKPNVRGNLRNWNNLKSHQLVPRTTLMTKANQTVAALECIMLGKDFKLLDDANILLRTPRQHNMYSIDLNNIVPHKDLTCLVAKASADEAMLWHSRLGHLNFKTMNRLVRHNLVIGLPSKCFENDHTCTAFLKGKQHKASCKSKLVNSVTKPLHTLHMDLFGLTFVSSISHKWYCLVLTDDFSRFTWTFFLKTKDETSGILRKFITKIENLKDLKVKIIRCDNRGEFRNKEMDDFCLQKGIKREFSNPRTPRQNGVAERRNRTSIEAARTMLADAKLPVTFWAEAVNTACYVQNKVLVNKSHNKTSYELFNGRSPAIGFPKPFRCHVMILNTLDLYGKFKAKGDEDESNGVEADISNMETTITSSPTPTLIIHKDHPKS
nr:putative ribonuclease H-like domain-containing protein [Tanacetum cinerariifolium]